MRCDGLCGSRGLCWKGFRKIDEGGETREKEQLGGSYNICTNFLCQKQPLLLAGTDKTLSRGSSYSVIVYPEGRVKSEVVSFSCVQSIYRLWIRR